MMQPVPLPETGIRPKKLERVAIMQPYLFPYLGYFHLIEAADAFVFYDDVAFIQRGWINRNRILINGSAHRFTLPLNASSQNRRICEIIVQDRARFAGLFQKTLSIAYARAPQREQGLEYVSRVLDMGGDSIADLARTSVLEVYKLIGHNPVTWRASTGFGYTSKLGRVDRLAAISLALGGKTYVNTAGGQSLYKRSDFAEHSLALSFVSSQFPPYPQIGVEEFLPSLSIIDLVMMLEPAELAKQLTDFRLVGATS